VFRVAATGSPTLQYQWRHHGTNLSDGDYVQGALSHTLVLPKVLPAHYGPYDVVVRNTYGATSSVPANLIVLENPRIVHAEESSAPAGGHAALPVVIQSVGDENTLRFSLLFNPAQLAGPRLEPGPALATATLTLQTNEVAAGRLGVSVQLPAGQTLPAAPELELFHLEFNVPATVASGTQAAVGFGDLPVARSVRDSADRPLTTLFLAGFVAVTAPITTATAARLPDGRLQLSFTALAGYACEVQASTNLVDWIPLGPANPQGDGTAVFTDSETPARAQRFYRARQVPLP
jgi:type 1 fimbria pilin